MASTLPFSHNLQFPNLLPFVTPKHLATELAYAILIANKQIGLRQSHSYSSFNDIRDHASLGLKFRVINCMRQLTFNVFRQ